MRKGKPLQRRTGLKTNTPLRATKPMKRSAASVPGKSSANPTRARRPKKEPGEDKVRAALRERSGGWCEVAIPGVCLGRATNYQHRINRSQQGAYVLSAALDCCGSGTTGCHGAIHAGPARAYRNGWSVRSWDDPLTKPVLYRGRMVLLDNEGTIIPSPAPGKAAA